MRKIKSIPLSLRPRERILKYGADALKTDELIAAILITGNRNFSVSQISGKLAKLLLEKNIDKDSIKLLGLGPSKTAQILALVELGKRLNGSKNVVLTSPEQIFVHCHDIIKQEKESLVCFYINGRGEMVKKEVIAVGTLNRVNLLPKEIFSLIKELPVSAIILAHNHPSGVLEPSKEDILFTKRVKIASDILGIKLLDHLIVSAGGWKKIKF